MTYILLRSETTGAVLQRIRMPLPEWRHGCLIHGPIPVQAAFTGAFRASISFLGGLESRPLFEGVSEWVGKPLRFECDPSVGWWVSVQPKESPDA